MDHDCGLLEPSLSSYNHLATVELPRMINELRPIVWSERPQSGGSLSVSVQLRFASVEKPRIGDNGNRILMPSQAQQLTRSYNGRLLVNVEITVREFAQPSSDTDAATPMDVDPESTTAEPPVPRIHQADIRDLCIGDVPVLVPRGQSQSTMPSEVCKNAYICIHASHPIALWYVLVSVCPRIQGRFCATSPCLLTVAARPPPMLPISLFSG